MSTYKDKYMKYKNKYLELKYGGSRNLKKNKLPKKFDKGKHISNVRKQRDKIGEKKREEKRREAERKRRRWMKDVMEWAPIRIDPNMQSIQDPSGKWIKVNKKLVKYSPEEKKYIPDGEWIKDKDNNYSIQRSKESILKELNELTELIKIFRIKDEEKKQITSDIKKYKVNVEKIIENIKKFRNDNKTNLNLYLIGEDHMFNIKDGIEKQKLIIKSIETILNKQPLIYHELPESLRHVLSEAKEKQSTVCEAVLPFLKKKGYKIELTKTERTDTIDSPLEEQNSVYIDEIPKYFSPSNKNIIAIFGLAHIKYIYDILNNRDLGFGVIKVHMINTVSEEILVKGIIDEKSRSKTVLLDTLRVAPYF